ncbi:chromosomal replication initiator protein DnaA [Candidatus Ishikawella capsulata]|uniref:chromosomal replication initiator protein DnaA n=1 Tax=Candidatus Ishikawella capsulata TaxID=168169 RepID=UPI0005976566|nr:chromosomal replication initiator protein DnaA [Candidatus Ishikawaella capsulata]
MVSILWKQCLYSLQTTLSSTEFKMWIRPLQSKFKGNRLTLYAPNRFILDWVLNKYADNIDKLLHNICKKNVPSLHFELSSSTNRIKTKLTKSLINNITVPTNSENMLNISNKQIFTDNKKTNFFNSNYSSNFNIRYTFDSFIDGKSNNLAYQIAFDIAYNVNQQYNPLFLYGSTGLGKTHLLHAIGNIISKNTDNKIVYVTSESFVQHMVKAIQTNSIEAFRKYYRSVSILLIDDIQYFTNKKRSQEELLHTINSLLEDNKQIILTCDRYPRKISCIEDRLKSRLGWGLSVKIDYPELETRMSIITKKAKDNNIHLSPEVVLFIAKFLKSNIRELEGALNRVIVHSKFTSSIIDIDFIDNILKDLVTLQKKNIAIDNIKKTVAKYYNIKILDLFSKRRSHLIVHPRHMAMAVTKKLTNYTLSEIGSIFGGRDHSTVIHACRKIDQLKKENLSIKKDFLNIIEILSI